MKFYLLLFSLILLSSSCTKNETTENTVVDNNLIGSWVEISPCEGCRKYTFNYDSIFQTANYDKTTYNLSYKIINDDSIQVTRNYEIEQQRKTTKHKFVFISSDTIRIEQFLAVDFGITGFEDVILIKSE